MKKEIEEENSENGKISRKWKDRNYTIPIFCDIRIPIAKKKISIPKEKKHRAFFMNREKTHPQKLLANTI